VEQVSRALALILALTGGGCLDARPRLSPDAVTAGQVDAALTVVDLPAAAFLVRDGRLRLARDLRVTVGPLEAEVREIDAEGLAIQLRGSVDPGSHALVVAAQGRVYRTEGALLARAAVLADGGGPMDDGAPRDGGAHAGPDGGDAGADAASPDGGSPRVLFSSKGPHLESDFRGDDGAPWSFGDDIALDGCSLLSPRFVEEGIGAGWTDVVARVRFRVDRPCGGLGAAGIAVRIADTRASCASMRGYYCTYRDVGEMAIREMDAGCLSGLGPDTEIPVDPPLSQRQWYEMAVEMVGQTLRCTLSGDDLATPVVATRDFADARFTEGTVGLFVANMEASFDDLLVHEP
jgi:hypothetical protein